VNSRGTRTISGFASGNGTAHLLLSAIVDSSDDAIISKDLDGVIMSWNKSAERLFGYTAEEAIGQTVAALLIPDDRQEEEPDILARLRKGERVDHFETVRRRKDGWLVHISLTISPVKDQHGRIIGASKIARDITQRKKYEKRLVEQAHLLDLSSDAILVRDGQNRILEWNRAAEKMYGFAREEVLGKISQDLSPCNDDGCAQAAIGTLQIGREWIAVSSTSVLRGVTREAGDYPRTPCPRMRSRPFLFNRALFPAEQSFRYPDYVDQSDCSFTTFH
jgi:PAS domain S-box-containing protein